MVKDVYQGGKGRLPELDSYNKTQDQQDSANASAFAGENPEPQEKVIATSLEESDPDQTIDAAAPKTRKVSIDKCLKDAIATHVQQLSNIELADPKMTGILAQKAAGLWRRHLDKSSLSAEEYQRIANSIYAFVDWFDKKYPGLHLPDKPDSFSVRYTEFVDWSLYGALKTQPEKGMSS